MYTDAHSSTTCNKFPKLETTCLSINIRINKLRCVDAVEYYAIIQINHLVPHGWRSQIKYRMGGAIHKKHIFNDSVCIKFKTRHSKSMLLKVKTVTVLAEVISRRHHESFLGGSNTGMFCLQKCIELYTYDLYIFMYECYPSIKIYKPYP